MGLQNREDSEMSKVNGPVPSSVSDILREETQLAEMERQLKQRRELLKTAKRELDTSTPTHHLAIAMHQRLCRWNHTDGCLWHYEIEKGIHDWSGHDHQRWLRHANQTAQRLRFEPILEETALVAFFESLDT